VLPVTWEFSCAHEEMIIFLKCQNLCGSDGKFFLVIDDFCC
jgi:hypothetical protein